MKEIPQFFNEIPGNFAQFFPSFFVQQILNWLQKTLDEITAVIAWIFSRLSFLIEICELHLKEQTNEHCNTLKEKNFSKKVSTEGYLNQVSLSESFTAQK